MLELYHHGSSVCAAKVRLALAEKGVAWTGYYIDILAGEQFRPEYLAINPRGAVPAIVHDGAILTESTVICEYIDDAFDGPPLKPADPLGQARMRMWTKLVDEEVHPSVRPVTYVTTHRHSIMRMGEEEVARHIASDPHPAWRERKRRWILDGFGAPDVGEAIRVFQRTWQAMDEALRENEWLAGEGYSLADIALTPYANRIEMLGFGEMWDGLPHFARWLDAVKARPSFRPALFDYLPDDLRLRMIGDGQVAWPHFRALLDAA